MERSTHAAAPPYTLLESLSPFSSSLLRESECKGTTNLWNFQITQRHLNKRPNKSVQGIHVKGYNWCSLGIVYEGGLDEQGHPADTRTEAQKHALIALLRALKADYPDAQILGHRDLPWVKKDCPCFDASIEYADLQP